MRFGYARVSTLDQSLETQIEQLKREGVDESHIFCEKRSGVKDRPQLQKLLSIVQEGDELHITKLDRLGRNMRELQAFADQLQAKGVSLSFNGAVYNPTDPFSKLFFDLLSVFADFERNLIAQRTSERLAAMKEQGVRVGRKRSTTPEQEELIVRLYDSGYSNAELKRVSGVSSSTLQRILSEAKAMREEDADPSITRARLTRESQARKTREKELKKAAERYAALALKAVES